MHGRSRFALATSVLCIVFLLEVLLLLGALGFVPGITDDWALAAAVSDHSRNPSPQTELQICTETSRLMYSQTRIARICSVLAVVDTIAFMIVLNYARRRMVRFVRGTGISPLRLRRVAHPLHAGGEWGAPFRFLRVELLSDWIDSRERVIASRVRQREPADPDHAGELYRGFWL